MSEGVVAPSGPSNGDRHRYRPARARGLFACTALILGLAFRFALEIPVDPAFFALVIGWYATVPLFFRWSSRREGSRLFLPARFLYFGIEVVVAASAAHLLGAGGWLAVPFVLFPLLEWNLLFPGRWGISGSAAAVLAGGVLVAGGSVRLLPVSPALSESAAGSSAYELAIYVISASALIGLSAAAGAYADSGRRKSLALETANAELRGTQAELVSSARLATLGMLAGGVAHEINTPLGALKSNHDVVTRALERLQEILADERVDESELEDVRKIVKAVDGITATNRMAVERMVQIVGSLRSLGRPDRSEIDRVDLHEGLDSTLELLRYEFKGRIEVVRQYGELPLVECYPNQINQVFMNLLMNARQAIRDEGTITVRTYTCGADNVAVEIQDTGIGIAAEDLDKIFEPGFTTKGSRVGMGLGLLISRRIIQRHGGRLDVDSAVGEGTSFKIVLPIGLVRDDGRAAEVSTIQTAR